MKEVYIIQSKHHVEENALEKYIMGKRILEERIKWGREISAVLDCVARIERDLILREGIEEIYHDGVYEENAKRINENVETICRNLEEEGYRSLVEEYGGVTDTENPDLNADIKSEIRWYEQLAYCRKIGPNVQVKATEHFPRWLVIAECFVQAGFGHKNISSRIRDRIIYNNMRRTAADKSILYMGRAHQLADFYKPDSGFAVAAVTITEQGPQYRFTNLEGIPDFFREIVEKRYAEMK